MDKFDKLEVLYWKLSSKINIERFINPINIQSEKDIFTKIFTKNKIYNPQFEYQEFDFDTTKTIESLNEIREKFIKIEHTLANYYLELIDENIAWIHHLSTKNNTHEFQTWITQLYGQPNKKLVQEAQNILLSLNTITKEEQPMSAEVLVEMMKQALEHRNFYGWKVLLEEIPARMSINQLKQEIRVKSSAIFSQNEIDRLLVHEIDTHVLRAQNAKKQSNLLFRYGFPNYLKTEEGLAILSEEKNNLLLPYDMQRYCMRVLASDHACSHSFYELFVYLYEILDFDDAFNMATRIKRGFIDSSLSGGYTKDQVYLDGYLTLKQESDEILKKLYYGKIGLKNLSILNKVENFSEDILYPEWIR